ncbi:MAG: tetratricopeptide repeat protein, partial [Phycisphaerae bacterium]|jgi:tetratricopeptide (TPR) repeat protein/polyferredoxin
MRERAKQSTSAIALPVVDDPEHKPRKRTNYQRWRAFTLSLVYVVFALHILHWKLTGKTLAPLELNEVMYTLEAGIITAGFLFMCFLVLGTLIFGRFFCSWACHIMVLQDLCSWILKKLHIKPRMIRSRLLLWVPPLTAFYMFIWPQLLRAWYSKGFPEFQILSDKEGWASFATDNFWRNLPSAPVIILTFVVCGFAIVYILGTRTFCTYVCPYGSIFALADRFSPGRLKVDKNKCKHCGSCTAACPSGIRVHEEVAQHGLIVNSACLKCYECVQACPEEALSYKFMRPSLLKSTQNNGRFGKLPYEFTLREELLIACVFIVVLLTFRGLYSRVPFLLSLAMGGIIGYFTALILQIKSKPNVTLGTIKLKQLGRLTKPGQAFLAFVVVLSLFVAHSAFVRYHEYNGLRQARTLASTADPTARKEIATTALHHLVSADRWGLIHNARVEREIPVAASTLGRFADAETYARRFLQEHPDDVGITLDLGRALLNQNRTADAEHLYREVLDHWKHEQVVPTELAGAYHALGGILAQRGDFSTAVHLFRDGLEIDPRRAHIHAELGGVLAELGRFEDAITSLREAVHLDPALTLAHYNLGTILGLLGRPAEAIPSYERALEQNPDDPSLHNNVAFAYMQTGRINHAKQHLSRALNLDPNNADAHFNLATILAAQHQPTEASQHYARAAKLDPRYARHIAQNHPE